MFLIVWSLFQIQYILITSLVTICAFAVPADKIPGLRPSGIPPPPPPIVFVNPVPRSDRQHARQRRQIIEQEMIAPTYTLPEMFTDLTLHNPDFNIGSGGSVFTHFFTTPYSPELTGTQFIVHNFINPQYATETFISQFVPVQIPPLQPYPPSRPSLIYGIN